MSTANPRVNVTLSPSLHQLVTRLASLQRVSRAMVLRELLETVEPQLAQAVALMEAAQRVNVETKHRLARDMEQGLKEVQSHATKALQTAANITQDLVAEAEAIRGRRPARGLAAAPARGRGSANPAARKQRTPLPSNRGVKS